ncbi:MAG: hypothetical protein ACYC6B_08495 [Thermoleophilia bacterium]
MVTRPNQEVETMNLKQKLENLLSAAAFAEAGEFDTAREIAREETPTGSNRPMATRPVLSRPTQVTTSSTKA